MYTAFKNKTIIKLKNKSHDRRKRNRAHRYPASYFHTCSQQTCVKTDSFFLRKGELRCSLKRQIILVLFEHGHLDMLARSHHDCLVTTKSGTIGSLYLEKAKN